MRASAKSEQTRQRLLDAAAKVFRDKGYAGALLGDIAREAGMHTPGIYYYFDSKEHLIQGFYDRNQVAHRAAAERVLTEEKDFAARLRGVLHAGIDVNEPYHSFAATFFKSAAEPSSPLSPFSRESSPAREAAINIFRDVVEGSGEMELDGETRPVKVGDAVVIPPGAWHQIHADAGGIRFLCCCAPPYRHDDTYFE